MFLKHTIQANEQANEIAVLLMERRCCKFVVTTTTTIFFSCGNLKTSSGIRKTQRWLLLHNWFFFIKLQMFFVMYTFTCAIVDQNRIGTRYAFYLIRTVSWVSLLLYNKSFCLDLHSFATSNQEVCQKLAEAHRKRICSSPSLHESVN